MNFSYPFLEHYLCQLECEGDEIFHAETLRTELKYWVGNEFCELFLPNPFSFSHKRLLTKCSVGAVRDR